MSHLHLPDGVLPLVVVAGRIGGNAGCGPGGTEEAGGAATNVAGGGW